LKKNPRIIFAQNPSIILALFAVQYGLLFRVPVIIDAHNAAIYPFNGTIHWANMVAAYLLRRATFTIVTNRFLADYVIRKGGRTLVIPDPVPEFSYPIKSRKLHGSFNVLFVCSWAADEPYYEVMKAAEIISKDIYIYITGKSKGKENRYGVTLPKNIVLTGFLNENDYIELMNSCDVVVDLTMREDCLLCGAFEALSLEKPMIISNSRALRTYFHKGALYTKNTAIDIALQINTAITHIITLREEIGELKREKINNYETIISDVELTLTALETRSIQ
jgi:glycosyltransferase involved in cell wall biosynthesis